MGDGAKRLPANKSSAALAPCRRGLQQRKRLATGGETGKHHQAHGSAPCQPQPARAAMWQENQWRKTSDGSDGHERGRHHDKTPAQGRGFVFNRHNPGGLW